MHSPGAHMASLIYHAGALGDFITTLPAIARWRQAHPCERHIILLGSRAFAALAPARSTRPGTSRPRSSLPCSPEARDRELFVPGRSAPSPPPCSLRAPRHRWHPRSRASGHGESSDRTHFRHRSFTSSTTTSRCSAPMRARSPHVPSITRADAGDAGDLRDTAAIHPGSGSARKNWPRARYIELSQRLAEQGLRDLLDHRARRCRNRAAARAAEAWRCLPLASLAARLSRCRLYVGNDSGVTHLAAAAGCPTVALFGASDPRVWAPRGAQCQDHRFDAHMDWKRLRSETFWACVWILLEEK